MQRISSFLSNHKESFFRLLIILVLSAGIVLRASKYVPGWSMRGDELAVTHNLLNRSAFELMTKPLDYEQAAPFGFLLVTKVLMLIFGNSEYVLRLVSFVSGCLALLLMYKLLTRTGATHGNLFALSAFAFADYLIYYSSELKQYSSDVLICVILALLFHRHISRETDKKDFWEIGVAGTLALCFSHPAIFVVTTIGLTLWIHYWKNKQKLVWISLVGAVWVVTFLGIYMLLLRGQMTSEYLTTFWGNLESFMPIPPWKNLGWFPRAVQHLFSNLGGLSAGAMVVLIPLYLYGLWLFLKEKRWQWIVITTMPIGINMIVSGFEKFPFHGRLIIYLLPLVFIVFGKAIDGLMNLYKNEIAANLSYLAVVVLLLWPAFHTTNTYLVTQSYVKDDLKPVLSYLAQNHEKKDLVYLYHYTGSPFEYYAPRYNLEALRTIWGQDFSGNGKKYEDELSALPHGQRIWFVFSFVGEVRIDKKHKLNERQYILDYLQNNGVLVKEFYSTNDASSVHLFILN